MAACATTRIFTRSVSRMGSQVCQFDAPSVLLHGTHKLLSYLPSHPRPYPHIPTFTLLHLIHTHTPSHTHTHTPSHPHTLIPTHLSLECVGNSFLCPPLCGFSPLRKRLVSLLPRLVSLLPRLVSLLPLRGLMWWKSSSAELYATFSSRSTCRGTDQSNNQSINN